MAENQIHETKGPFSEIRFNVSTENYNIISNGTIVTIVGETTIFEIDNLIIKFKFEDDDVSNLAKSKVNTIDNLTLEIVLINYTNPSGKGLLSPFKLGKLRGKELFINWIVNPLEKGGKAFHYTFYTKK